MLEIGLSEILMVSGVILAPLLTVIGVLWKDRTTREEREDARQISERAAYDAMRDRMQDKIDAANKTASEAVLTATNALNSMKDVLISVQDTQRKQGEQWPIFKDELITAVSNASKGKVKP